MANGDAAAAKGMPVVSGTADRRQGYDEINLTRDLVAAEIDARTAADALKAAASHTHTSAQISDATSSATPNTIVRRASSGTFLTITPTADTHVANKKYVDDQLAAASSNEANGPTDAAYARTATGSGWYQVWMNSSNQFMRNTSSKRYKKNIRTLTDGLARILQLRAVTYQAKDKTVHGVHIGLIAEEVAQVFPEVVPLENGHPEAVNYEFLVAPLIAAVQELATRVAELESRKP